MNALFGVIGIVFLIRVDPKCFADLLMCGFNSFERILHGQGRPLKVLGQLNVLRIRILGKFLFEHFHFVQEILLSVLDH